VIVAALLGALLLGAVAAMAARWGLSTVGLLAPLFGPGASPAVAALLFIRNVAWGAFALVLIADAAALVSERALGAGLRPLWVVLFGLVGIALAAAGPRFVVGKLLKRAGLGLALLVAAVVTLSAYLEFGIPTYLDRPAVGGWPSFWQAVDVMLTVPLLWLPLVADYARFDERPARAFSGTFVGTFVATAWLGLLGMVYLPAVQSGDVAGFVVGLQVGLAALVILLIFQADEVFANVHSAGLALKSMAPLNGPALSVLPGLLVIALALPFGMGQMEGLLLLLASLFVPLFGVLFADRLLGANERGAVPSAVAAWAAGFLLYQWIAPADVQWWRDAVDAVFSRALGFPFPLTDDVSWLGAALPSLLAGFLVHLLARPLLGRLRSAEAVRVPAV
ncbi:MAG TPA: hypothetical protein VFT91_08220, partial [Dehalococcoidia bacterium]|nr:hypothetical protein [Dehalococcoidia bacterium]